MIVKVGGTVKALVQMENDLRDEGMGVTLCAEKGDILDVHEILRGEWLIVSRKNHSYKFGCKLSEVCES